MTGLMKEYTNEQLVTILDGGAKEFFNPENTTAMLAIYYTAKEIMVRCGEEELTKEAFIRVPTLEDDHEATISLIKQTLVLAKEDQPDGADILFKVVLMAELERRMKDYVPSEV